MSGRYAENTSVPVERSKAEIEKTLERYGASKFMYGWDANAAVIGFEIKGRRMRFELPLPDKNSREFWYPPKSQKRRTELQAREVWAQACRQRWRALALVIKAKLEAVEAGISTIDEEFLAHIVLPSGATAGQWLIPQIDRSYQEQQLPPMLPLNSKG